MKKNSLYFVILFLTLSCKQDFNSTINHLSGYWEIESVTLEDGTKKKYNINETIDYIKVNKDLTGIRKKMKPTFTGTYETSKNNGSFEIKIENDSLTINYKTPHANWKETVVSCSKKQLKIVNKNNVLYSYKRYTPLTTN